MKQSARMLDDILLLCRSKNFNFKKIPFICSVLLGFFFEYTVLAFSWSRTLNVWVVSQCWRSLVLIISWSQFVLKYSELMPSRILLPRQQVVVSKIWSIFKNDQIWILTKWPFRRKQYMCSAKVLPWRLPVNTGAPMLRSCRLPPSGLSLSHYYSLPNPP